MNTVKDFTKIYRGDRLYKYESKWKILCLDVCDKNGIWSIIQKKIEDIKQDKKLENLNSEQIKKFFLTRPEIQMEINFFSDLMSKCLVFKYKRKIYCYTYGKIKRKNGIKIIARFYFDLNNVLSLSLPI